MLPINYGSDIGTSLAELLEELVKIEGIEWIRTHYFYPEAVTEELIDVMAKHDKICNYIDIPVQHGDDEILRRMARRTNQAEIRNTVDLTGAEWNAIHTGMRQVVESKSYYSDLKVNVAGKTGTAEESKSRANHALFVCYAPYENPEIAIATRIAYGYSSDYAARTTKDVISYYFDLVDEEELITDSASQLGASTAQTD